MNDRYLEDLEVEARGSRPIVLYGYLALSLCVGVAIWGAIFSVSIINSGLEPVDVASLALGFEQPLDDPMIVASDADLYLIEPAAGPAHGCE